jgi:hypothetical protein
MEDEKIQEMTHNIRGGFVCLTSRRGGFILKF